ncbi:MAG: tetratricopeptide repeat protein [Clostridia bacterium]
MVEFYQKGEGFYHLRLYEQARGYFEKLVEDAPDWETGRLYYAYSLLFCEETEAAFREFRLLSKSAASPSVSAISCNAIGCMLAKEGKWLEARQAYMESLSHQENQREAMYNLALTHLHDGEADEALEILDEYLTIAVDDWEAHIAWLHAAKMIASKETHWMRETPTRLQLPIRQLDCDTIREIAIYLEANGETFRAYNCYRELISQNPRNDWAWHGLAWNTWLIHGTQPALPMLKKAVSLAPANLDYLFSYGWLLLFDGDESSAARVFRFILAKDEQHSLALAGLIVASERLGEFAQAQRLASSLTQHKRSYLRALGYYQLGRLAAISERWPLAAHYFHQSVEEEEAIPEAKLFLELCSKQTEPHRAEKSKQDFQSSLTNMTIH